MAYVRLCHLGGQDRRGGGGGSALERIHRLASDEPDILVYQFHRDPEDPRRFFFYEQYRSAEAYERHLQSAYVREHAFGDAVPRLTSRERTFWTTWDPGAES